MAFRSIAIRMGRAITLGSLTLSIAMAELRRRGDEGCENNDEWDFGAWAEYSGVVASVARVLEARV